MKRAPIFIVCVLYCLVGVTQSGSLDYFPPKNYGGKEQLKKIVDNEVIGEEAPKKGKIHVQISIDENGKLVSKVIFKSSHSSFNAAALRVVDKLLWHPAYMMGTPVGGELLLAIPFNKKQSTQAKEQNPVTVNSIHLVDTSNTIYLQKDLDSLPEVIYPQMGYSNISDFVLRNFEFPETAIKYSVQGKVAVEFVVEPRGYLSNLRVVNQLGAGCDIEVVKWINQLYFSPAMKDGKLVRTTMKAEVLIRMPQALLQVH